MTSTTCKYTCELSSARIDQMESISTDIESFLQRAEILNRESESISKDCNAAVVYYNDSLEHSLSLETKHDAGCSVQGRISNLKPLPDTLLQRVGAIVSKQRLMISDTTTPSKILKPKRQRRSRNSSSARGGIFAWVCAQPRDERINLYRMVRWLHECERRGLVDFKHLLHFNSDDFDDCIERTVTLLAKVVTFTDKNINVLGKVLRSTCVNPKENERVWNEAIRRVAATQGVVLLK